MPEASAGPRSHDHVLVAVAGEHVRPLIRDALSSVGYQVDEAAGPLEVARALCARDYGFVVIGPLSGSAGESEAVQSIRSLRGGRQRIPIIATATVSPEDGPGVAARAGVDAHLIEPIDEVDLLATVERISAAEEGPAGRAGRPLVDPNALRQIEADVGLDSFADVMGTFASEIRVQTFGIRADLERGALTAVGRRAHRLTPNAATVGARQLASRARRVEIQAGRGEAGAATAAALHIVELGEEISRTLEQWVPAEGRARSS